MKNKNNQLIAIALILMVFSFFLLFLYNSSSEPKSSINSKPKLSSEPKSSINSKPKLSINKNSNPAKSLNKNGYMRSKDSYYGKINYEDIKEWVDKGIQVNGEYLTLDAFANKLDRRFKMNFNKTLGLSSALEYPVIKTEGGKNYLQVIMQSTNQKTKQKSPLNICFVIDRSGSMNSEDRLGEVKNTLNNLVGKLSPEDKISIVAFSETAEVLASGKSIDERKEVKETVNNIYAEGGTDINIGLVYGIEEVKKHASPNHTNFIILLSDGEHNGTILPQNIYDLSEEASKEDFYISTLGFGLDHDETLLSKIAKAGNGKFHFVANSKMIESTIEEELFNARSIVAKAIRLQVILNKEIELKKVFGFEFLSDKEVVEAKKTEKEIDVLLSKEFNIQTNREKVSDEGLNILIPNLVSNQYYLVMMEIEIPEGLADKEIAQINLKYKDLLNIKNDEVSNEICQKYSNSNQIVENFAVKKSRLSMITGEALQKAAEYIKSNEIDIAQKQIDNQIKVLKAFYNVHPYEDIKEEASTLVKYSAIIGSLNNPQDDNTHQAELKRGFVAKSLLDNGMASAYNVSYIQAGRLRQ